MYKLFFFSFVCIFSYSHALDRLYIHNTLGCNKGFVHNPDGFFTIQRNIPLVLNGTNCADKTILFQDRQIPTIGITSNRTNFGPYYPDLDLVYGECRTFDILFSFDRSGLGFETDGVFLLLDSPGVKIKYNVFIKNRSCPLRYLSFEGYPEVPNIYTTGLLDLMIYEQNVWGGKHLENVGPVRLWATVPANFSSSTIFVEGLTVCMQASSGPALCRKALGQMRSGLSGTEPNGTVEDGFPLGTMYGVGLYKRCDDGILSSSLYAKALQQQQVRTEILVNNPGYESIEKTTVPDWNIRDTTGDFSSVMRWQVLNGPRVPSTHLGDDFTRDVCFRMWDRGDFRYIVPLHRLLDVINPNAEIYNSQQQLIDLWWRIAGNHTVGLHALIPGSSREDKIWFDADSDEDTCVQYTSDSSALNTPGLSASGDYPVTVGCHEIQYIGCLVEVFETNEYETTLPPPSEYEPLFRSFRTYADRPRLTMKEIDRPLVNVSWYPGSYPYLHSINIERSPFQLVNGPLVSATGALTGTEACMLAWDDGKSRKIVSVTDATSKVYIHHLTYIFDSAQRPIGYWPGVEAGRPSNTIDNSPYTSLLLGAQPKDFIWSTHGYTNCRNYNSTSSSDRGSGLSAINGAQITRRCDSLGYVGCLVEILENMDFVTNTDSITVVI